MNKSSHFYNLTTYKKEYCNSFYYLYKLIIAASLVSRSCSISFILAVTFATKASSLIPDKLIRTFKNAAFTAARALIAAIIPSVIRF